MPSQSTLFKSNRSQALRMPKDQAFPDSVRKVFVRTVGKSRIITPVDALWDDFFDRPGCPDFFEPEDLPPQERDFS
jgi:antitoxin VapB